MSTAPHAQNPASTIREVRLPGAVTQVGDDRLTALMAALEIPETDATILRSLLERHDRERIVPAAA